MDKLKLCPFCGNQFKIDYSDEFNGYMIIHEFDCPMETSESETGFVYDSEEDAIAHLNTRPIEDALNQRIAELEAQNNDLRLSLEVANLKIIDGWFKYPPASEAK